MLNVLLSAPMFDEPARFRSEIEVAMPGARIAVDGELPDEAINVIIADDHTDPRGRHFPNLTAVLSLSAGVDGLLIRDEISNARIVRLLTPDHQQLMREYVVYHVLRAHGQFRAGEEQQRARRWEWLPPASPVAGKKAVVLGMGFLGAPTATALRDLGLMVTSWSRTARTTRGITSVLGENALLDALGEADFVVCLLPLTDATRGLLNAARLGRLPSRAFLINASRAACLELTQLVQLLHERSLAGAVLDVFENEPLSSESPLWTVPNLTITPHMAAVPSAHAYLPVIVESLRAILMGGEIPNTVDRNEGY